MPPTPTVTVRYTQAIIQAAERLGFSLPHSLQATIRCHSRVSLDLQGRIWDTFCEQAQDPLVGLQLGLEMQAGHLDTMGMVLMSCETLGDALDGLMDYYPIVGEGGQFQVHREHGLCAINYQPDYVTRTAERVEAVLASLLNLIRWGTGQKLAAHAITMHHRPLAAPARYQALLGVPVTFSSTSNSLWLAESDLARPLTHANPALCEHLRTLADQLMEQLDQQSLSARARDLVRRHPHWGKEKVAQYLGMSGRHLVRKLSDEGTSFKLLRDTLLQRRAEQGLRDGKRLGDISDELGFSDDSAFAKAFKRWTGTSPAQFRKAVNH